MKIIKKEIEITYHEDVNSGSLVFQDINPGDINYTAMFNIEGSGVLLYINLNSEKKVLSIEIDGMKEFLAEEIITELEKSKEI